MSFQIDCPRCGGSPDFDEHGFPYTCFSCGDTGYVWIEETYAGRKTRELNEAYEEYVRSKVRCL
jgi:ribosomal protein S27AE